MSEPLVFAMGIATGINLMSIISSVRDILARRARAAAKESTK